MERLFCLQVNGTAIVLLIIMYINVNGTRVGGNTPDQNLFKCFLLSLIAVLWFDAGMWIIDGQQFPGATELNYIITIIYFFLNPVVGLFWVLYGEYKLLGNTVLGKRMRLYLIPVVLNLVFVLISLKTEWIFFIDAGNIYHRGRFVFITPVLSIIYFIIVYATMLRERRKKNIMLSREIYTYFYLVPIPPSIGAILQLYFFGVSMIWMGMLVSVFIIFINIQNNQIYLDSLTRVYNRRYIDNQLMSLARSYQRDGELFVFMIDVDDFKTVNDTYGHAVGDEALIAVAEVLKSACGRNHSIARFGGDEFIILGRCQKREEVKALTNEILRCLNEQNGRRSFPFAMSLSVGSSIYDPKLDRDVYTFMKRADEHMYTVKRKKR